MTPTHNRRSRGNETLKSFFCRLIRLVTAVVFTTLSSPSNLSAQNAAFPPTASAAAKPQSNYPRFRGWDGSGATSDTNISLTWDDAIGKGIAWKSAIPAIGYNSPVVWEERVFVSGGSVQKREVFCYYRDTGAMLWRREVPDLSGRPPKEAEMPDATGVAASTTATDGRRLFVIFGNGDLAALNFDGTIAWSKSLGPLKNPYGHASSLAVWQGAIVAQLDGGENASGDSRLVALDGVSGRILWSQPRPVPISWATPIVTEAAGKTQIITLGQPWVISYAFADGHELWRAELLENEIVPSPIFAGGLVIAVSPSAKLIALRPDGAGNVTKTHVAWSADDNPADAASPVSNGELVFTVADHGLVTCFDLKNGRKIWEHDLDASVQSSPSIIGNRLFVLTEKGAGIVLEAGRQFREIGRSKLADQFFASPAFASGRMFLRGNTNLYCIGPTSSARSKPEK